MRKEAKHGKMLTVEDGYIKCPFCNKTIQRITEQTHGEYIPLYCRACRREVLVDILRGQSARRRSP